MSQPMMLPIGLAIHPLDLLVFRDGRPFDAGARAESGLPTPQTFAGAVRTWLLREHGCDFEQLRKDLTAGKTFAEAASGQSSAGCQTVGRLSFRGPWFARGGAVNDRVEPLIPVPAVLQKVKGSSQQEGPELCRLGPLRTGPPGWMPAERGMLPLWSRNPRTTEPLEGYLTLKGVEDFLRSGQAVPNPSDVVEREKVFAYTDRTGIAIEPDKLAAEEGRIYGLRYLELRGGICLYGEVLVPENAPNDLLPNEAVIQFGGEGRRCRVQRTKQPARWPSAEASGGDCVLLLLTTPGLFDDGWRPASLNGKVISAAVPKPTAISGWDLARGGPKPNRFAAPAGSVYFLKELPSGTCDSLCEGEYAELGWGTFLKGVWTYV